MRPSAVADPPRTAETLIRSASRQKIHQTPKNDHAPRRRRSNEASTLPPARFCTTKTHNGPQLLLTAGQGVNVERTWRRRARQGWSHRELLVVAEFKIAQRHRDLGHVIVFTFIELTKVLRTGRNSCGMVRL
jgi:hypothetical protein